MADCLQVVTTVDTKERAEGIARSLVEKRLAACVQVAGPMWSTYWWRGKLETAEEWSCTIKTVSARYAELEATIRLLHPYEEPEIIAFPISDGSQTYLQWVEESTQ